MSREHSTLWSPSFPCSYHLDVASLLIQFTCCGRSLLLLPIHAINYFARLPLFYSLCSMPVPMHWKMAGRKNK
jgi:hypothetical protein